MGPDSRLVGQRDETNWYGEAAAAQDLPTNANCKCPISPVTAFNNRHFTMDKRSWAIKDLVRVAVVACKAVRMGMA